MSVKLYERIGDLTIEEIDLLPHGKVEEIIERQKEIDVNNQEFRDAQRVHKEALGMFMDRMWDASDRFNVAAANMAINFVGSDIAAHQVLECAKKLKRQAHCSKIIIYGVSSGYGI